MISNNISKSDEATLLNMGIDPIKCKDYQILCLPENFQTGPKNGLYDADLSCKLSKILKQNGVKCANSYDLGIDSKISIRQTNDIYLGLVWILDNVALPLFTAAVYDWFKEKINNKGNGNNNNNINVFNKNIIHIEIKLPNGNLIKYDGDAENLKKCLEEGYKL
jgi:hypothetical protein